MINWIKFYFPIIDSAFPLCRWSGNSVPSFSIEPSSVHSFFRLGLVNQVGPINKPHQVFMPVSDSFIAFLSLFVQWSWGIPRYYTFLRSTLKADYCLFYEHWKTSSTRLSPHRSSPGLPNGSQFHGVLKETTQDNDGTKPVLSKTPLCIR